MASHHLSEQPNSLISCGPWLVVDSSPKELQLGDGPYCILTSATRISVVIVMVCMATMLGSVIALPSYLHVGLGVSVLTTGLRLLPGGLVQGCAVRRIRRTRTCKPDLCRSSSGRGLTLHTVEGMDCRVDTPATGKRRNLRADTGISAFPPAPPG